ncbi:CopD family protein [Pseudochelatococcus sp. B33]
MTSLELALLAVRFLHLAALVQAVGALVFLLAVAPRPEPHRPPAGEGDPLRRLIAGSLAVSIAGALLWLMLQAVAMTGDGWRGLGAPGSHLAVLSQTRFGQVFGLRLLLLLAAAAFLRSSGGAGRWPAALLLGAALLLQPWLGHGAAAERLLLPLATALHVLAASVWLGALLPLWLTLRSAPASGALAARRFSPVGIACVTTIAATAVLQWPMIGDGPRFIGTSYGLVAGVKTVLFIALLAFAAANRFVFTPRALAGEEGALRAIRASVLGETLVGLALIGAAASLASLPTGAHEQPVWPFPIRPVSGLWDDAFLRDRIIRTLTPLLGALVLVAAALLWRRMRWPLFGAAIAVWFWMPSFPLKPYVREAFPTTYQQWARARSPASLQYGADLFLAECAGCHAADARGRGPLATGKPAWPPDLTAPLYHRQLDGDLFWRIGDGMTTKDGAPTMPAFRDRLDDGDIWTLVDFIRARGSARSLDSDGRWTAPTRAPAMSATCMQDGRTVDPARPGGAALYVETVSGKDLPRAATDGWPDAAGQDAGPQACAIGRAGERQQWLSALAILTETDPQHLQAAAVLIDAQGWLRRLWRTPPLPEELAAEVRRAREIPVGTGEHHN